MKKQITKGCNGAGESGSLAMVALSRPPAEPSRYLFAFSGWCHRRKQQKMRDAVPSRLSYELGAVQIGIEEETLVLATPTPGDDDLLHRLSWILNRRIRLVFCTADWLQSKQLETYGLEAELAPIPEPRETFYNPSCNWRGKDGHTLMVQAYGYVGTTFWDGALAITCNSIDIDFWRWLIETSEPQQEISQNQLEALKCQWNREKSRSK